MKSNLNLAVVGLTALKTDEAVFKLIKICEGIGLFHRIGMLTENGEDIEAWRVERMLERFPCLEEKVWLELLERMRRIHGEIAKCEALIEEHESPFRVHN